MFSFLKLKQVHAPNFRLNIRSTNTHYRGRWGDTVLFPTMRASARQNGRQGSPVMPSVQYTHSKNKDTRPKRKAVVYSTYIQSLSKADRDPDKTVLSGCTCITFGLQLTKSKTAVKGSSKFNTATFVRTVAENKT